MPFHVLIYQHLISTLFWTERFFSVWGQSGGNAWMQVMLHIRAPRPETWLHRQCVLFVKPAMRHGWYMHTMAELGYWLSFQPTCWLDKSKAYGLWSWRFPSSFWIKGILKQEFTSSCCCLPNLNVFALRLLHEFRHDLCMNWWLCTYLHKHICINLRMLVCLRVFARIDQI